MKDKIASEIERIDSFKKNIKNGVGIFGSARESENGVYYNLTKYIAAKLSSQGFQVISGGGPGIMKAAIEGAKTSGCKSIALNIKLPFEDSVLPSDKVSIDFDYFMTRKLAFAKYCDSFIVMPGGFGTMDELFEMLTLIQTRRMKAKQIFLFGTEFWAGLLKWLNELSDASFINEIDLNMIHATNSVSEILSKLKKVGYE
ncbi:TIGR00730 family Rossman fold protein [Xenorhabdus sp. 18]|uniref:LOG family protein n=1 Tax=Xenorhabdus doucetiae TaxID=351671 RepID=UPI0019881BB2|nr:TIGR00730 family Rossman fold protein [Xenorhabdus sp. 18]MBD2797267.1 TIGR00730 family Rossman fold protein [Xenorhabdus sp. 18]